ncbi:MAG: hypothetical protein ACPG5P_08800, partial [Saprospiraceae bacterium]
MFNSVITASPILSAKNEAPKIKDLDFFLSQIPANYAHQEMLSTLIREIWNQSGLEGIPKI